MFHFSQCLVTFQRKPRDIKLDNLQNVTSLLYITPYDSVMTVPTVVTVADVLSEAPELVNGMCALKLGTPC